MHNGRQIHGSPCFAGLKEESAFRKSDYYLSILTDLGTISSHPYSTVAETEAQGSRVPSLDYLGSLPGQGWLLPVMASPASLISPLELRTILGRCEGGCQGCGVGISELPGFLAQRNQPCSAPLALPPALHFVHTPAGLRQLLETTNIPLYLTPNLVG